MSVSGTEIGRRFLQRMVALLCLTALILGPGSSVFGQQAPADLPEIEVVGLFKDMAVLNIEGRQSILKVGQEPVAGVVLISADSESAVIEFAMQRHTVFLSQKVAGAFKKPEIITVSIQLNKHRQYLTTGSVNDVPVSFLVDTGATLMAMNSGAAKRLGIEFGSANVGKAITAGGEVKTWRVSLSSVQVGGIRRENVEAAVLEGNYPLEILLGMTFLRNVKMEESDGVLVLSSKF